VEAFTRVQLLRRSRAAGGLRTARKQERVYLFRGLIRCCACGCKMEGSPRKHGMYYRCPARTLTPGSAALSAHPRNGLPARGSLRDAVNGWIGGLFSKENVDRTIRQLIDDQR
jgi:hypothetical protein